MGEAPEYLIRDNDAKYGSHFTAVAAGTGIELPRTPIKALRATAIYERLLGSIRGDCLDHIMSVNKQHLRHVLLEYVRYFNQARPHKASPIAGDGLRSVGQRQGMLRKRSCSVICQVWCHENRAINVSLLFRGDGSKVVPA